AEETEADGRYHIDMALLNSELELAGTDTDACVAEWRRFIEESAGMTAGIDYVDGVFVYPATSVYDASLTAGIFGGEFISFLHGIATMRVANHSTVDVIQTCIDMSAVGNIALPEIYPDMIWKCLGEDDSEDAEFDDEIELQFAIGGYEDWSHGANKDYSAWNYATGKGVKVAVLDTGAGTHSSIKYVGNYNAFVKNYADEEEARRYAGSYKNTNDNCGHGTAMAGVATGRGGNSNDSIVGVAPEALTISIKCMENYGDSGIYGDVATITRAVYMAVAKGCKIINISAGGRGEYGELFAKALREATNKGAVVICGAGNNGNAEHVYPAAYPQTIAVAATKKNLDEQIVDASYSSYGSNIELAAPGTDVMCAMPGNLNKKISGTSVSSAMVAGAVALYMERNPELQSVTDYTVLNKIRDALRNSAEDYGDAGWDEKYGWGLLDTAALVGDRNFNPTDVPKISVPSGPLHSGFGIKLSSSNGAGSIYYTLDGTVPTVNSLKYTSERDMGGYIYLPANMDTVTLTAISIGLKEKTKVATARYTIIPDSIAIDSNKYTHTGILGKSGFNKDCKYITGVSKGKDMPYQKFTATLNSGDSMELSLTASGFNGELHIVVNDILKASDVRPVTAAKVGAAYARTLKYTNATAMPQSISVIVTSGQLLPGQQLLNGSGKYVLNANITRAVSKLEITLPTDSLVRGSSMTPEVKITPYNATNQKIHWKLYDKYGDELDKNLATVDGYGRIKIIKDVAAMTEYRVRAISDENSEIFAQKVFKVYPLTTRMEIIDDVVEITTNGAIRTYDASTNFLVTPGNCLNKYTYKSLNEKIAKVSENGIVSAVGKGMTRIVVYAMDGSNKKGAFYVNVTTLASSILLKPSTKVEAIKNYYPAYAGSAFYVLPEITPAGVSNTNVEYEFSGLVPEGVILKKSSVKIEKDVKPGTTFAISARCLDGSNVKNTIYFRVYDKPELVEISKDVLTLNTINEKSATLTATVKGKDGTTTGVLQNVVWTSGDEKVVKITQGGVVTAIGRGNAIIRATSTEGAKVFASCKVRVISGVTSIGISTAGAMQSPSDAQPVVSGRKTPLRAICTPDNADNQNVEWSLELAPEGVTLENGIINVPPSVVSGSVLVKATAKDGFGATKTRSFNIYSKPVTKVVISSTASSLNTVTAPKCTLTAVVSPRVGTFGGVVWKSSDERVATVSQTGVVTAVGKGSVTITAYSKDGYGAKSAIRLNVVQPMTSFEIESGKGLFT
ncbi:MAG: S8 family serine peptidase, partial [Lachnospiraceae bacterium]|nr:S8 family serine peptidase [Candidatus Colinaster scatohippi]